MLKYTETEVVFEEIPNEVTLAVNISGCPCRCPQCHSKHLWKDIGKNLSYYEVDKLLKKNKGITCICFMGGDADPTTINALAEHIKYFNPNLKVGWYSGREEIDKGININNFDYIKIGPYVEFLGPLNKRTTNQIMYKVVFGELVDITIKFWVREERKNAVKD